MAKIKVVVVDGAKVSIRLFDDEDEASEFAYDLEEGQDFVCANWYNTTDGSDQVAVYINPKGIKEAE